MPEIRRPPIPSVRARRAGELLREFRERAGLSQAEVAAWMGTTQGAVSHYESARRLISLAEAERLMELYAVPETDRATVLTLINEASRHGWWMHYADIAHGPFFELEDSASSICIWNDRVIPGLFQTQQYARAVFSARGGLYCEEAIEKKLRARANRQLLVTRPGAPPVTVVLDEAVLERPVGGEEVFRNQLRRLAADAELPSVTVQILPKAIGTHPGLDGSFILLQFEPPFQDIAYTEGMHGATYLESPSSVAECRLAFEGLLKLALSPAESQERIEEASRK